MNPDSESKLIEQAQRMKERWNKGDYARFSYYWRDGAKKIADELAFKPNEKVIDIACGNGNLSVEVTLKGAEVTGIDINPNLVEQAKNRAREEGLIINYLEGNGMQIPFPSNYFDAAVSLNGIMFCPKPEVASNELLRVCKPGSRIFIYNWTPTSLFAELIGIFNKYIPIEGSAYNPMVWGTSEFTAELFSGKVKKLECSVKEYPINYPFSIEEVILFYRKYFPRGVDMDNISIDIQNEMNKEFRNMWEKYNKAVDGTVSVFSDYLELKMVK